MLCLRIAPSRTSPLSAVRTWMPSLRIDPVLHPPASAWFHFRKSSEYRPSRDLPSSCWSLHIAGFRNRARLAPRSYLLPICRYYKLFICIRVYFERKLANVLHTEHIFPVHLLPQTEQVFHSIWFWSLRVEDIFAMDLYMLFFIPLWDFSSEFKKLRISVLIPSFMCGHSSDWNGMLFEKA